MQVAVGGLVVDQLIALQEGGEVEHVLVEGQEVQHPRAAEFLVGALAHQQDRLIAALDHPALVGGVGGGPAVVLGLVDEEVVDQAAVVHRLGIDRQTGSGLGELTLAHEGGGEVGAHLEQGLAHLPRRGRLDPEVHEQSDEGDDPGQPQGGRDDPPAAHAAGETDHDLLLHLQAVERHQGGHQQGDGQDHVDQLGHGQQGHLEEDQGALSLADDDVELRQAGGQQGDRRQRRRRHDGRPQELTEQVSIDQAHRQEI